MTILQTKSDQNGALDYLLAARKIRSQVEIARQLGVSERQVRRWEARENPPPPYIGAALQTLFQFDIETVSKRRADFKFVDLFAGIGGIRLAFEGVGGECVFTSEWDTYAQKTYMANFQDAHSINGDITKIDASEIPDHDVLLAGFPCQPFSIAGVSKKNALGRKHGFSDETQGTLFFDIARIIAEKSPQAFMLENVKNLQSHDKGRTFDVIIRTLRNELGYNVFFKVIDAAHFLPQHRERIIIVGFRDETKFNWNDLVLGEKGQHKLGEILHKQKAEPQLEDDGERFYSHSNQQVLPRYTLTDGLWTYLQNYKKKHQEAGNGFGFGMVNETSVTRTLSARYYKDGSEILLSQGLETNPRRLTPRECARLMGFQDSFKIPVSDTRAYKQFGNSVAVPVIEAVAKLMKPHIAILLRSNFTNKKLKSSSEKVAA